MTASTTIQFPNPKYNAATAASSATSATGSGVSLGGTDFLTLMLAQLENQDPTSPIDSNAFLTQLAQLSEVQGIGQLNTSFSTLSSSLASNQTLQASSLLGHQALVGSSTATLTASGNPLTGAVRVPQTSSDVTLNISDASGVLVKSIDLGAQTQGMTDFTWDGTGANGAEAPAGVYQLSAQVNGGAAGTAVATFVNGTVDSVTLGAGTVGMTLNISGLGSVALSDVTRISN